MLFLVSRGPYSDGQRPAGPAAHARCHPKRVRPISLHPLGIADGHLSTPARHRRRVSLIGMRLRNAATRGTCLNACLCALPLWTPHAIPAAHVCANISTHVQNACLCTCLHPRVALFEPCIVFAVRTKSGQMLHTRGIIWRINLYVSGQSTRVSALPDSMSNTHLQKCRCLFWTASIRAFEWCAAHTKRTAMRMSILMSMHMSMHMSIRMSIHMSIPLSIHMSIRMPTNMPVRMPIHMRIHMPMHMPIHMPAHMPAHMPIHVRSKFGPVCMDVHNVIT